MPNDYDDSAYHGGSTYAEKSVCRTEYLAVLCLGFVVALFTTILAFAYGRSVGQADMKKQAIEHGHAEWVVNDEGYTTFKWIPKPDYLKVKQHED